MYYPIFWDSGASISVSSHAADFNGTLERIYDNDGMTVNRISSKVDVIGRGTVLWYVLDMAGMLRAIKVPALYIPTAKTRLLSTTSFLQTYAGETIKITPNGLTVSGIENNLFCRSIDM
jgi:hypothetical protein